MTCASYYADNSTSEDEEDNLPDVSALLRKLPEDAKAQNRIVVSTRTHSATHCLTPEAEEEPHAFLLRPLPLQFRKGPSNGPRRRPRIICDSDDECDWVAPVAKQNQQGRSSATTSTFADTSKSSKSSKTLADVGKSNRLARGLESGGQKYGQVVNLVSPLAEHHSSEQTTSDVLQEALAALTLSTDSIKQDRIKQDEPDVQTHDRPGDTTIFGLSLDAEASLSEYYSCSSSPTGADRPDEVIRGNRLSAVSYDLHNLSPATSRQDVTGEPMVTMTETTTTETTSDDDHLAILSYSPPPPSSRRPKPLTELISLPTTPLPPASKRERNRSPFRESDVAFWDEQKNASWTERQFRATPNKSLGQKAVPLSALTETPKKTSLEIAQNRAKRLFINEREDLATGFLATFIADICPELSNVLSDPIEIKWSKTLASTAGRASYSKTRREAKIELSTKVIDCETRLRSTLAHEMCHILVWCIDAQFSRPHGKEFKKFGALVEKKLQIKVETTHDYEISYKYQWQCINAACTKTYSRHSKSIDPKKSVCSLCHSRLEQILPKPRRSATPAKQALIASGDVSPSKNAGLQMYQVFLKENIGRIKEANPGMKYAEIIKLVAGEYAEFKKTQAQKFAKTDIYSYNATEVFEIV